MGDFGPHPISIADVHAYVQLTDLTDVEARLRFLALVRALDCVYLTHQAKKAK